MFDFSLFLCYFYVSKKEGEKMDFNSIVKNMQEKLGEENSSLISDDFASLMTFQNNQEKEISTRNEKIARLEKTNESLVRANGNLLQQVADFTTEDENVSEAEPTKSEPLDYRTLFDKNGKFIQ